LFYPHYIAYNWFNGESDDTPFAPELWGRQKSYGAVKKFGNHDLTQGTYYVYNHRIIYNNIIYIESYNYIYTYNHIIIYSYIL
jgi:hypothetical protein